MDEAENKQNKTQKNLNEKDYFEISIMGDGNSFYRCLSQYFDNYQEHHPFYRQLIYDYIVKNKELLKAFYPHDNDESIEQYNERYNRFIDSIQRDGTYAGNYEISAAALSLNVEIYIYRKTLLNYEFLQNYSPNENCIYPCIYIVYRNNIHFNLLYNKIYMLK